MKNREPEIWAGVVCCLLAGLGQFATDYWFVRHYPGYRWMAESASYLGQVDSPVRQEVAIWGAVFAVLMAVFGWSVYRAFPESGRWARLAGGMLLLYGIGEGLGSGLLPVDPERGLRAPSYFLHDLFSIAGDAGLMLLPPVMLKVLPRKGHPAFFRLSWITMISGLSLAALFTLTKMFPQESGILYYRGVWQRLYILIYHIYLVVVAFQTLRRQGSQNISHD